MNESSSKLLDDVMVFFEQFRLPLLFIISGTGTVFAFSKRTWKQFIKERASRLLIPLIFGVFIIVPPQTYIENINSYASFIDFYKNILNHIEVNHLWFIENLFYLSVLCVPFILFIKSKAAMTFKKVIAQFCAKPFGMLALVIPLILLKVISKKYYPTNATDITNLSTTLFYGYFFITGITLAGTTSLWTSLRNYRKYNLLIACVSSILFYTYYFLPDEMASSYWDISTRWDIWYGVSALVSWTVIITLLGYGQVWFSKPSVLLTKLNEGIYPFYILHQTILIMIGYYVLQQPWNIPVKLSVLAVTSFIVIVCIYRFGVYPFKITGFVFGMKKRSKI